MRRKYKWNFLLTAISVSIFREHYSLCFFLFLYSSHAQKVLSLSIDGGINPSSAAFIRDGIKKAEKENAECLVIHLNTPGGLLKSTRQIVSDILESPVPIIVFVSPAGSHAGSAGVFITLAAHIAAMTPGTNIGAAHPVAMQQAMDSTMSEKSNQWCRSLYSLYRCEKKP